MWNAALIPRYGDPSFSSSGVTARLELAVVYRNEEGIPASPFRTDDWPLFDPNDELVTVEKPAKPDEKTSVDWKRPVMTQ